MGPGALGLCATRETGHYRWGQDARQVFIALPHQDDGRARARAVYPGCCAWRPRAGSRADQPDASDVFAKLRPGAQVNAAEYAGLLEATRALALLTLRNLGRQGMDADLPDETESLHVGRYAAALRFMEQNAHRPELIRRPSPKVQAARAQECMPHLRPKARR